MSEQVTLIIPNHPSDTYITVHRKRTIQPKPFFSETFGLDVLKPVVCQEDEDARTATIRTVKEATELVESYLDHTEKEIKELYGEPNYDSE